MAEPALKICAKCQFKNSAQKNYCDRCGTELGGATTSGPPIPGAPDAVVPQTMIVRKGPQGAAPPVPDASGFALPEAGRSQQVFAAPPTGPSKAAPRPAPKGPGAVERAKDAVAVGMTSLIYVVKSALAVLFLLGLGFAAFLFWRQQQIYNSPAASVKTHAETYLEMMRLGDYANAYETLTPAAMQMTKLDEFREARDARTWTWSNPRILKLEPASALVAYDLSVEGRAPETDYLFFTLEGKRWLRPYNWTLLRAAELSLRSNDPDMAILKSQAAVRINPRDPLARAVLCEANYYRRLLEAAVAECKMALELSGQYASKAEPRTWRHVRAVLADSLRGLGDAGAAAGLYDAILSDAETTPAERCDALKARAAARQALGQADAARADADAAAKACWAAAQ